ncbi:hypothetical protein ONZ45_g8760 [Pleurotus djamor]|nr:hypothetical protein ONZ45_g13158 [Pleurotus djamor]KAJ8509031.1 hypothetical protein ONZ45_g8760 [Pleurotus djamor]
MSFRNRVYVFVGVGVLLVYALFMRYDYMPFSAVPSALKAAGDHTSQRIQAFPMSEIMAHAPGFTVINNLYWYNHTYYLVTDQPWQIPPLKFIASLSTDGTKPAEGRVAIKVKSIRLRPVSPEVREENQIGETISLDAAERDYAAADVIEGPMIINNDDNFTAHYYHWIGETFLGAWRVWSNYAWRSGKKLPEIKRVAFTKQYSQEEAPPGSKPGKDIFNDKPGANVWFTEKFFPGVQWDTKLTWEKRAATERVFRITTAVIADRHAGHAGPSSAYKPWGDVLRLPVSPDWLVSLRNRVFEGYHGPTPLAMPERPLVMYLQRQDSGRRLVTEDHLELVRELKRLQKDGVADYVVESFNSSVPFAEQVARISRATILVAVHGNGLTHSLWMTPTTQSAVFEFQPSICTITDYSPLAIAAGVQHYMVHETDFCLPMDCPGRHCDKPNGINTIISLTPTVVTDEIRRILA